MGSAARSRINVGRMADVMSPSRPTRSLLARLAVSAVATLVVAGCVAGAQPGATATPATTSPPTASPATTSPSASPDAAASPANTTPEPTTSAASTTQTGWGLILDSVPAGFPRYPGATTTQPPPEPVSDALETAASVDDVAGWYRDALGSAGFATTDLSSPLEDGSRVLDAATSDSPCRAQLTFRPLGSSTMIIVLYGAGCAGTSG